MLGFFFGFFLFTNFLQKLVFIVKILKIVTLTPGTKLGSYEGFKV